METQTGKLTGTDGVQLFYQGWLPSDPVTTVLILHAHAGHGGRFAHVAEALVARGMAVWALDQRGHGQSEGERGYIKRYDHLVQDAVAFINAVPQAGDKRFLYGHSMGANVALRLIEQRPRKVDGVILSGVTLDTGAMFPGVVLFGLKLLGELLPRLQLTAIDPAQLTHDPGEQADYKNDPLVNHQKVYARYLAETIRASEHSEQHLNAIATPMLILHGSEDPLAGLSGARRLYERAGATDKTLEVWDNIYHEVHNEPAVKDEVIALVGDWIKARA